MKLKNLKIGTQLSLGLGIILLMIILLGLDAIRQTDLIWQQTKKLYDHPMQVRHALGALKNDINNIRIEFRNALLAGSHEDYLKALTEADRYSADAERQFAILFDRYLGSREDIELFHQDFLRWDSLWKGSIRAKSDGWVAETLPRIDHNGDIGRVRTEMLQRYKKVDTFADNMSKTLFQTATELNQSLNLFMAVLITVISLLTLTIILSLLKTIRHPLQELTAIAESFRKGEHHVRCQYQSKNELGTLSTTFNALAETIQGEMAFRQEVAELNGVLLEDLQDHTSGGVILEPLMLLTGSQIGALYLLNSDRQVFEHLTSIGLDATACRIFSAAENEGVFGLALSTKQVERISDIPDDTPYTFATVGGEFRPREIITLPLIADDKVVAILSLAAIHAYTESSLRLITAMQSPLSIWINSTLANSHIEILLKDLEAQNSELQSQQEELRVTNEELAEQSQRLQQSEEELKTQQEELQVANEELEEKNELLECQKRSVEEARKELEEKAAALAVASKYKSEFLANMSHELRTPLNSLLLLSQGLARNKEGNLSSDQVEAARIIHDGGSDLLNLINDILDLSKIEAGRVDVQLEAVPLKLLADGVRETFSHMTEAKGISLDIIIAADAPAVINSDRKKIDQILRNLIANAIKFTEKGGVTITFAPDLASSDVLTIAITDTGIGIPAHQHRAIFEAFQQGDGSTSRRYGGTGLGLSISRELATLLGGEIKVKSEVGKGSTFTLSLPLTVEGEGVKVLPRMSEEERVKIPVNALSTAQLQIADDRADLDPGDQIILVIEDDPVFAKILYSKCQEKGLKCLATPTGEEGLQLAIAHLPCGIILDLHLPGIDGWSVLHALKEDTSTRHIPVHILSADGSSTKALRHGAVGQSAKPIDQDALEETFQRLQKVLPGQPKRLLVVEDDPAIRHATIQLVGNGDVTTDAAETGAQALEALRTHSYNCVVLDLNLPDMNADALLAQLQSEGIPIPPVIIYTARDLTRAEEEKLREYAESIVIKGVCSQERLFDEVSLFLHRVVSRLPEKKRRVIQDLHDTDTLLKGKKILVVDDDLRTTFAVAHLLGEKGMTALKAESGERALHLLKEHPDIDLVLMDIMMPVMDGYETMERIRGQEIFATLPIIALTAKAMPEDRARCLTAGASDYLPKPVDPARLFSMMRVWLCR